LTNAVYLTDSNCDHKIGTFLLLQQICIFNW